MKKKRFLCPNCFSGFTRSWNLQRHVRELHGIILHSNPDFASKRHGFLRNQLESNTSVSKAGESSFDTCVNRVSEVVKMSGQYAKYKENLSGSNEVFNTLNHLRSQVIIYQNQIENVNSNFWLLSNKEIQGISGYFCKRCRTISFRPIRDIGFDMTAMAKHYCDEEKVRTIFMVTIRKIDEWNNDNWIAGKLLGYLNSLFPVNKFLYTQELSSRFDLLSRNMDSKTVYEVLGLPHRYPFYFLQEDHQIEWVTRTLNHLGQKILMNDDEILDFLRRVKSTYGVIEIQSGQVLRRILMTIVP
jgi:hypothetical protein